MSLAEEELNLLTERLSCLVVESMEATIEKRRRPSTPFVPPPLVKRWQRVKKFLVKELFTLYRAQNRRHPEVVERLALLKREIEHDNVDSQRVLHLTTPLRAQGGKVDCLWA